MATKNNPGTFDCLAKLEPDEPYFVLRGKDPIGSHLVEVWRLLRAGKTIEALETVRCAAVEMTRSGRTPLPLDSPKSQEATRAAADMYNWYRLLQEKASPLESNECAT